MTYLVEVKCISISYDLFGRGKVYFQAYWWIVLFMTPRENYSSQALPSGNNFSRGEVRFQH